MKKLYELALGDTFWHGNVMWKVVEFTNGDRRGCRPTSCPETGAIISFHIDEEVQTYDF